MMAAAPVVPTGIEILYDASSAASDDKSLVDVVAVHGIGAHPEWTWTTESTNWLGDSHMLPRAVPNTRVLQFGYESQWLGKDALQQRLSLVADQLLHGLMNARKICAQRPIVLIGHCFGGLVIQRAILNAKLHDSDFPNLVSSIAGVIFLGTPHRGSNSQSAASLIASIASTLQLGERSSLLHAVEKDSDMLTDLLHDFVRVANVASIPLFCFFEQHKTDISKVIQPMVPFWPSYMDTVVDERSGCIDGFPKLGLACDHFRINKFSDNQDPNYCYVKEQVVKFVDAAPQKVQSRLRSAPIRQKTFTENDQRDQACLAAIFITDPNDDMEMIETRTNKVLRHTGTWILSHELFSTWLNAESSILCIHGDPGKGKTMLAISLIKELQNKTKLEGNAANTIIAYFFCDSKDARRQTALCILQGILYQILCQRPDQIRHLRSEYERQKEHLLTSPNSLRTLWRILQKIFKSSDIQKVYVVIDGLDECESESIDLLLSMFDTYIKSASDATDSIESSCAVKWLLTSRNEDAILQPLHEHLKISLEDNTRHVDDAIKIFIDENVQQLQKLKHYTPGLAKFVEQTFQEKAEGTFLWVALACRELSKPKVKSMNTKGVLQKLPSGLNPLYSRIMEQVLNVEDDELIAFAKAILRAMLAAYRPLKILELAIVANLPDEVQNDVTGIEEYVDLCGSFVTTRQGVVRFVHSSAKDYMLTLNSIASLGLREEHKAMALNCLRYLSMELQDAAIDQVAEDMADPPESARRGSKSKPRTRAEYPVRFWMNHTRSAADIISDSVELESSFFQPFSKERQEWVDQYWDMTHAQWEKKPREFTSLHLASYAGLPWLVSLLLGSGATVSVASKDSLGNNALMWASRNGFKEVVNVLLEHDADVAATNNDQVTALYIAADNGHDEIVRLLLEQRASVHTKDKLGWTPLHRAAHHGHSAVIHSLLDHGSNTEKQDSSRWTVLQRAVSSGQLSVVKLLIDKGADPDVIDREGMSLLNIASWRGHADVAALLLKHNSDVELTDDQGWTPLQQAAWGGHTTVAKLLLRHKANTNAQNSEGNTALHQATWNGHTELVKLLLENQADPSITCANGESPLQQAAWRGHIDVAELLLSYGIDVDAKSKSGHSALHQAASNGQDELVKLLIEAGADLTLEDDDGETPFSTAKNNHHESTAELLKVTTVSEFDEALAMPTSDDEAGDSDSIPLDHNIIKVLGLKMDQCHFEPYGQAGFSNPGKITAFLKEGTRYYFVKTGPNEKMFEGEHESLTALNKAVPGISPISFAYGKLSESPNCFLLTEFLDVNSRKDQPCDGLSLPQKLAQLHSKTAPPPEGQKRPMFGFPFTTFCGATPQDNTFRSSWAKFFAENRLRAISTIIEENHGTDDELRNMTEEVISKVVPKLLRNGHLGGRRGIQPVLVHGDLWSGNKARGVIGSKGLVEEVIFDASSCYAHSEYELSIMRMFGGFSAGFFNEYHRTIPKTQPKEEYEDRMKLYQLYHYLNHHALFCGGYRDDAIDTMTWLLEKHAERPDTPDMG